ncbi:MAG: DUF3667 domain-containing protein, partial [Gemmatimonadaceae bacterium]|nr:DUF3667 domain-containing protein [Gemmatimonadaceae bacterium]
MAPDPTRTTDDPEEQSAPADRSDGSSEAVRGPFTLASLLDLDEDELAQPVSRVAPSEHRWEHLSLGVSQVDGALSAAELRTGVATQPPASEMELIPGLDAPGAVEVPVYLAGRSLSEFLRNTLANDVIPSGSESRSASPPDIQGSGATDAVIDDTDRAAIPTRPPAIAVTVIGRRRKAQDAPAANFGNTVDGQVLWPTRQVPSAAGLLPEACARCGAALTVPVCAECGHDAAADVHLSHADRWGQRTASLLESDNRFVRTIAGLVLAPGELTAAYLVGERRRYFTPTAIVTAALILFAIVSALGGLRPRPDRALTIGTDRTAEVLTGLVASTSGNLAIDAPPDLLRDLAIAMDYVPLLWFPLMAFGILAVVAALRTFDRHDDKGELVFTAHFATWFVLWWGLAVPMLLLLVRLGFEYSAAWEGVERIRSLKTGQIEGLSPSWNAIRAMSISPAFHSSLVGLGLAPWAIIAYRRAFSTGWLRAGIAGLLTAA